MGKQQTSIAIGELGSSTMEEDKNVEHRRRDNPDHDIEHQVPPQWHITNHIVAHNTHGHNTQIPARKSRDDKPGKAPQQGILRGYIINPIHKATDDTSALCIVLYPTLSHTRDQTLKIHLYTEHKACTLAIVVGEVVNLAIDKVLAIDIELKATVDTIAYAKAQIEA